jgi:hypothetical protein
VTSVTWVRSVFVLLGAAAIFGGTASAWAVPAMVPVPRPRPADMPAARPEETAPNRGAPIEQATPSAADERACLDGLAPAGFEFELATTPPASSPACVIETPVRLKAVKVVSRPPTIIRLPDEPILSCKFVERFGHWLGDLVGPLIAARLGSDVKAVRTGPGYECRNRNRAENGKLSAHATGLAVDIMSFELANGQKLTVKPNGDERARATIETLRTAACGWFTTILGPGSDAAHAEHMHVDILPHGSSDRYRICQ